VNEAQPQSSSTTGRRTPAQRRRARLAGVDREGRPLKRSLGISPTQLLQRYPHWDKTIAIVISNDLLRRHRLGLPIDL
jgi:hypothetical protein